MTDFSIFFIMLAALLVSACASQPGSENLASEAPAGNNVVAESSDSSNDPDELICRREQVTGTNFRRRVCMTRAERAQRRLETQEAVLNNRTAINQ